MSKQLKTLTILFKAHQSIMERVKQSIEGSGLSLNEFAALEALYTKDNLTTQQLIDMVLIPNSSMTYVVDQLERKNYVKREKDALDRRVHRVTITANGIATFAKIYDTHYQQVYPVFEVLSNDEEQTLQVLLKRLGKHAAGGDAQ